MNREPKYGFDLDSPEEFILFRALLNKVRIEGIDETNINEHHSSSLSGLVYGISDLGKGLIEVNINIDNVWIKFLTNPYYKKGYMNHYFYPSHIDDKWKFSIYLPADKVLNGETFHTYRCVERRNMKIKKIISKIKNEEYVVS